MNRLAEELARFCDTHRLEEKIFVSPSLAIGHQIAETVVREGYPWINLRIETVHTLAHSMIETQLVQEGLRIVSRAQALAMVEQTCLRTLTPGGYFGKLRDQPGFHRALKATIEDMRVAMVSPRTPMAELLENSRKGHEIQIMIRVYENSLAENHLVDHVEILRRALEKVKAEDKRISTNGFFLIPESLELSSHERDFLERLASGRIHVLAADDPSAWNARALPVQILSALGEENEVREVFRRILGRGIEADRVEVLYTDPTTYLPLIYELGAQYGINCTYAEGVPVVFSRPGQAVLGYLAWLGSDYDVSNLSRILAADVVDLRKAAGNENPPGPVRAARVLRDAGVGWGRERYLSCLNDLMRVYRERERTDLQDSEIPRDREFHSKQINAVTAVRSFVQDLFTLTPVPDTQGRVALSELALAAALLVEKFSRRADELDGMASMALRGLFEALSSLPAMRIGFLDAIRRLREAVGNAYVGAQTPEPGYLHISDFRTGGYSGREYTFILGLDESRYPGTGLQDPILLDHERRVINEQIAPQRLSLLGQLPQENTVALRACLARLRGRITMSYSCRNLIEDREQFPAPFLLDIYRSLKDDPATDYTALRSAIGTPAGFIPSQTTYLDETEWWLSRLKELGRPNEGIAAMVRAVYPWLAHGYHAQAERISDRFTVFDGWIKDTHGEIDPRLNRVPVSCTEIEALARCPFAYFLRYVLEVEPPDDYGRDPTVWLDAMAFGILLHEIFHSFMAEITAREEKPNFTRHWERLRAIAEECITRWRHRMPPPNLAAFTTQRSHVFAACYTFLKDEEIHCQQGTPRYFEIPFGLPGLESAPPIGSPDPVSIDIGEGKDFMLRGRIDRVDHKGRDEYEVWDYKSGSSRNILEEKQLNRGRQIQHALYARAVEILLARVQKQGRVTRSGYFFPGLKGEGQRIAKPQDTLALEKVLGTLFGLLRDGIFPYAPDPDFCGFCDYRCVCKGPEKANAQTQMKLENRGADGNPFEPMRRLMDCDD